MGVSYKPLLKFLIDKEIKKTKFAEATRISTSTLSKLNNDEYASLDALVRICRYFNCQLSDVCKVI